MIGNVPDGWRVEKLGNITDIVRNGINVEQFDNGLIPISRIETISYEKVDFRRVKYVNEISDENLQKYLIYYGDILFSHINSPIHIGKTAIYKDTKQIIHGANLLLIRVKNENPDFINYFLKEIKKHKYFYSRCNKSVNQASIKQSEILKIPIPIPPLPQQEKIVKVLDITSQLIEKQKELIENYDLFLKSKFIEMFGDPIKNPMGWEVEKLKDISTLISSGSTPKGGREVYVKEGILFFRSQNVWKNKMLLDDIAYIDEETHLKMKKSSLKHKDILITKTGRFNTENSSLGRAALFLGEDDSANVNGHVYLTRLKKDMIPEYVVYILTTTEYRDYIRRVCVGGIDKRQINKTHLEQFPIIFPPIEQQEKFTSIVKQVDIIKAKETQKLEHLETLHSSLMDKAFKGNIK